MDQTCIFEFCNPRDTYIAIAILVTVGIIIFLAYALVIFLTSSPIFSKNETLNKWISKFSTSSAQNWQISHFILYFIIGFIVPDTLVIVIILIGLIWEVIEAQLGSSVLPVCFRTNGTKNCNVFWYESFYDILCNLSGFLLGASFRKIVFA